MTERIPAEVFPLAEFLGDEMLARGWTTDDVAVRMRSNDIRRDLLMIMLLLSVQREGMLISDKTFDDLATAFDVDPLFLRRLDAAWRGAPPETRRYYSPPDELFGPISRRGFIRVAPAPETEA